MTRLLGFERVKDILERIVFDDPDLCDTFLRTAVVRVLTGQVPWRIRNFHFSQNTHRHRVLNIHCVPIRKGDGLADGVVGIVEDITESLKRDEQLQMLATIGLALQSTIDRDYLIHLLLTSLTAGQALGFTRAMFFMVEREGEQLVGKMGVGPSSNTEARRIWDHLQQEHLSLEEFLQKYGKPNSKTSSELNKIVRSQTFSLKTKDSIFIQQILRHKTFRGLPHRPDQSECYPVFQELRLSDFIAVPVVTNERLTGVIFVDHLYNLKPIEADDVSSLELVAGQAAQALEKAIAYRRQAVEKRKLEQAYKELKLTHGRLVHTERLAAIGNMATHVAHEIRNPLVTIGGFARSLQRKLEGHEDVKSITQIIADETIRLEKILVNVLDFAKRPKPKPGKVRINEVVTRVHSLMKDESAQKGISLKVTLDHQIPSMVLDGSQMTQLLINLIRNGIQATDGGGEVAMFTSLISEDKIEMTVSDQGKGIPTDQLEKIFQPFYTTKATGTGIGLAICQQITNDHGGNISVRRTSTSGTTFSVELPVRNKRNYVPTTAMNKDETSSPYLT